MVQISGMYLKTPTRAFKNEIYTYQSIYISLVLMAGGGIIILFCPPAAIGATTALSLKITGSALMSGGIAGELKITILI